MADKESQSKLTCMKSSQKQQQLSEYAGAITVYAVILTVILVIILLKMWFGIDVLGMIGNAFKGVSRAA